MKRFFTAFLVLIMLTPAMLCVMPVCADGKSEMASMDHHHQKQDQSDKVRLVQDCMGVDLQITASADTVKKPDLGQGIAIDYIVMASAPVITPPLALADHIRGPPPGHNGQSHTPDILLITQRLLI